MNVTSLKAFALVSARTTRGFLPPGGVAGDRIAPGRLCLLGEDHDGRAGGAAASGSCGADACAHETPPPLRISQSQGP
jgi:hypothetical protein